MRHLVPALEFGRILEPEVGGEVDDLDAGADQFARLAHRYSMRGREEYDLAAAKVAVGRVAEAQLADRTDVAQAGKHLSHRHAGFLGRRNDASGGLRMDGQQPQQLDTRVSGAADNADIDHRCPWWRGADSIIARRSYDIGMECAPCNHALLSCVAVT